MFVLDTDHLSFLDRPTSDEAQRILLRMDEFNREGIATTVVNYEEHTRGWLALVASARSVTQLVDAYRRLETHVAVYRSMPVLGFDEQAAIRFQDLKHSKVKVGTVDLRIAAIALVRNATLVTRNRIDFDRVPGLKLADWSGA